MRSPLVAWLLLLSACTPGVEPELAADATIDATVETATETKDATADVPSDDDATSDGELETPVDAASDTTSDSGSDTAVTSDSATAETADASSDAAVMPAVLAKLSALPRDVAAGAGYVFVTTFAGEILRIPRDGGDPLKLASPERPTYVAVDATHVYWTDLRNLSSDPGKIGRVPIAGGPEEILATGLDSPNSCTLSDTHVYFAQWRSSTVSSVPNVVGGLVEGVATGQLGASYVAANDSTVCWVHDGLRVSCKPKTGGSVTALATEASGTIYALAIDGTHAFWAMRDGSVRTMPLTGGTPLTLAPALDDCPLGADIELDATRVYWSCGPNVRSVPKAGGASTLLFKGSNPTLGIAIDATRVYWTTGSENSVKSLPK